MIEDLTSAYGRDLRLSSFLETLLNRISRDARVEILYYNQEQATLEQIEHIGFNSTLEALRVRSIDKVKRTGELDGTGICAYVALTGESVLAPYVRFDRRYQQVLRDDATQSEMAVPIKLAERVIGVLNFEADVPRGFGNTQLEYVQNIAPLLAVMLEYETFRREEDFLGEILPSITTLADSEEILIAILSAVLNLLGSDTVGCVMVPVGDSAELTVLRIVVNRGLNLKIDDHRSLDSLCVVRRACQSPQGQCFWSSEEEQEDHEPLAENIRSEFATVMQVGDRVMAVLDVGSTQHLISERYGRVIRRLSEYGAALLYGLEKNSEAERKKEQETVLKAVDHEVHNATGMLGLLLKDLELNFEMKDVDRNLGGAILERLSAMQRLVKGFLSPPRSVKMNEVIQAIQEISKQLRVDLTIEGDFDFHVLGTKVGFVWLFENLVLNTRKHGERRESSKAWLTGEVIGGRGVIRYWDDQQGPPSLTSFLNGRPGRQGVRLITALCKQYNWNEPEVSHHLNGSVRYEFHFDLLPAKEDA